MIKYICTHCNTEYARKPSIKKTSFCSNICKYASGHNKEAINKIKIARGRQIIKTRPIVRSGYIYIKDWSHPFCGKQGYVAEHRLVMEKFIGRFLSKEETIHHINHIMTDNRIENLQLFSSRGAHTKHAHPEIIEKSSAANKGKRRSMKTEFTKGQIPWNKK